MLLQNASNRTAPDLDVKIEQSTMNACVAPIGILVSHPRTMSCSMSILVRGLPGRRRSRIVHFRATRVPGSFAEAPAGTPADVGRAQTIDDAWWKNLGDPVLEGLLKEALTSAPSIVEAQARVREARALAGIAGAERFPTADAGGAYARNLGSENVPTGVPPGGLGPGVHSNLWQARFDASWEIDIFGGERRTVEAAEANYQAVSEGRADVVLTLLAEVARDYVELRGAQRRIEVARNNLAIERDLQTLTQSLLAAGLAPAAGPAARAGTGVRH
jgi:multidrug efflux system outer membrane protein